MFPTEKAGEPTRAAVAEGKQEIASGVLSSTLGIAMLKKRSFSLSRHRTSVALESEFWAVLEADAHTTGKSLAALVGDIDAGRGMRPLASALRIHALAAAKRAP
jgi:predicted DNA-binding ribbon-helix-helix protein